MASYISRVAALVLAASGSIAAIDTALAQTSKDLVGTWSMTSNVNILADGKRVDLFGPKGTGMAIFDANGRFAIVNVNPNTPKFASNSRAQGTPEENKAAVLGNIALYGTYSVADKTIAMKVEGSSYPNWAGTEQKRAVLSYSADEFKWTLPASVGGTAEVTWKRIK